VKQLVVSVGCDLELMPAGFATDGDHLIIHNVTPRRVPRYDKGAA
jgi:hypothetical protein